MSNPTELPDLGRLGQIGHLISTQDNRYTDQPMFVVQQRRRVYGFDTDYCENIIWVCSEDDYSEASVEEAAELETEYQESGRVKSGWQRTGYMDHWEFVTACFTEQGCKDYLRRDGHNLKEPRIYADGSYRNEEFRAVRDSLIALARRAQPEGEAQQAVYQYRNKKGGDWIECSSDSEARIKRQGFCDFFEFRTLYTAPAATLSPLCGAQHAESGKESIRQHEAIEAAVDECYPKKDSPHASVNDKIGAARMAFRKGYRAALAAQQAAAPAVQQVQASTTRVTETKRAQLEARGYEVVGYVMQNSVNELCTLAHGRVEWLGKGTVTNYGTSAPGTPEAPQPPFPISGDEIAALRRFQETCEDSDSGGYDVEKDMMKRLAAIGVIESKGFGRYQFTKFGDFVVGRAAQLDGGQEGSEPNADQA